ncbi:MAG: hypothetical protein ACK58T_23540, partial [Phycisphaerae bacterium]
ADPLSRTASIPTRGCFSMGTGCDGRSYVSPTVPGSEGASTKAAPASIGGAMTIALKAGTGIATAWTALPRQLQPETGFTSAETTVQSRAKRKRFEYRGSIPAPVKTR